MMQTLSIRYICDDPDLDLDLDIDQGPDLEIRMCAILHLMIFVCLARSFTKYHKLNCTGIGGINMAKLLLPNIS